MCVSPIDPNDVLSRRGEPLEFAASASSAATGVSSLHDDDGAQLRPEAREVALAALAARG
jgi:hypothetical protein